MAVPFIKKGENDSLLFTGKDKELVFYIPEKYFERNIAEQEGEFFVLLGIFSYTVQDINTGKNNGLHQFNLPTRFTTKPGEVEKAKQLVLTKQSDPEDYRIFRYREDDIIFVSTKLVQDIANVEKFANLFFILGYIPNTIPYDHLYDYVVTSAKLNGFSYPINNQVMGVVISEVCRAKDKPEIPWRLSGSQDVHAYQSMSVKNVSKLISPYTALLSEDFDESILYAMMNDEPKETSLEHVLVGTN